MTAEIRQENSTGAIAKVTAEIARAQIRLQQSVPDNPPGTEWTSSSAAAVMLQEEEDFRYCSWSNALPNDVNAYGVYVVRRTLELLVYAHSAPVWLAFPAGLFLAHLSDAAAETDAASVVSSVIGRDSGVIAASATLAKANHRGFLIGVDSPDRRLQVPVLVSWTKKNGLSVTGLARRADGDAKPPRAVHGSRTISGPPDIYVAYCGEIKVTERNGIIGNTKMGQPGSIDLVLDLAHYFRPKRAMKVPGDKTNHSGEFYFIAKACGNRTEESILNAPVVVSTVLVQRVPCIDAGDDSRPFFWFAARRHAANYGRGAGRCFKPTRILSLASENEPQPTTLTVNLFNL